MHTIRLSSADNVVTALRQLDFGTEGAVEMIPRGHKMASDKITKGQAVLKYAQVIGYAATDIAQGAHVHTHNLEFRAVDVAYDFATNLRPAAPMQKQESFMGYRRTSGRVG
ncbi:MAG: UxaA family hydrolase, partial [Planktomarina temperata]|nr:UxaA family hydrolase [Planktomarina temperata]